MSFLLHFNVFSLCFLRVSLITYAEQFMDYDPFLTSPEPSNPWTSDDPTFWDLEARYEFGLFDEKNEAANVRALHTLQQFKLTLALFCLLSPSKEPSQQRVKKWGFSLEEALKDPAGQELFLKFLESEFSSENLRLVKKCFLIFLFLS